MTTRSFRPVIAVASVAAAALSCYLVSLRVATERAALEEVETEIVLAQRDIRTLQTEVGTRGRLEQLERWNVRVLALSVPKADQFLDGGYQLARLARPSDEIKLDAPVVLASAPKPQAGLPVANGDVEPAVVAPLPITNAPRVSTPSQPAQHDASAASLLRVASYHPASVVKAVERAKPPTRPMPDAARPQSGTDKVDPLAPLKAPSSSSKLGKTGAKTVPAVSYTTPAASRKLGALKDSGSDR